jgi:small subunit ribosomal protein S21
VQVFVRDNNVDQALRVLKRKMQRGGVFKEMRRARFYEKPSEQTARRKSDAVRRFRKLARRQAIRDGLIVVKPKKRVADGAKRPTPGAGATAPTISATE